MDLDVNPPKFKKFLGEMKWIVEVINKKSGSAEVIRFDEFIDSYRFYKKMIGEKCE